MTEMLKPTAREQCLCGRPLLHRPGEMEASCAACRNKADHCDCHPLEQDPSWTPVDLTPALDGTAKPVLPVIGARDDGIGMFYPGKTHTIVAESEAGKSWLALVTICHEARAGHSSIFFDFEDAELTHVGRLKLMGLPAAQIREHFIYLRPETPVPPGLLENFGHLGTRPRTAWIDGITEAMTLHGLDPNNNKDVAMFNKIFCAPLIKAGLAVVSLDHVVKSAESRGRYGLGGVHKLNAVTGAQYILENREPFGIGLTGRSTIRIAKDRHAQLRLHGLRGGDGMAWFADLVITSHGENAALFGIEPPHNPAAAPAFRPATLMAAISEYVAANPGLTQNALLGAVKGKRDYKILAIEILRNEGYLRAEQHGQRRLHYSLKPFGDSEPDPTVPPVPQPFPADPREPVPVPPPPIGGERYREWFRALTDPRRLRGP